MQTKGKGNKGNAANTRRHWLAIILSVALLGIGGAWGVSAALAPKSALRTQAVTRLRIKDAKSDAITGWVEDEQQINELTQFLSRMRLVKRAGEADRQQWIYQIELYHQDDMVQEIALVNGNKLWDGRATYAVAPSAWQQLQALSQQVMGRYRKAFIGEISLESGQTKQKLPHSTVYTLADGVGDDMQRLSPQQAQPDAPRITYHSDFRLLFDQGMWGQPTYRVYNEDLEEIYANSEVLNIPEQPGTYTVFVDAMWGSEHSYNGEQYYFLLTVPGVKPSIPASHTALRIEKADQPNIVGWVRQSDEVDAIVDAIAALTLSPAVSEQAEEPSGYRLEVYDNANMIYELMLTDNDLIQLEDGTFHIQEYQRQLLESNISGSYQTNAAAQAGQVRVSAGEQTVTPVESLLYSRNGEGIFADAKPVDLGQIIKDAPSLPWSQGLQVITKGEIAQFTLYDLQLQQLRSGQALDVAGLNGDVLVRVDVVWGDDQIYAGHAYYFVLTGL